MSFRRRLFNIARAEAISAATRLKEGVKGAASGLFDRKPQDAFEDWAEMQRLREEIRQQVEQEGAVHPRFRDNPKVRRYYANLELPVGATAGEVKAAYRRLMRRYHPDRQGSDPERAQAAHDLAHQLREAYEGLLKHLAA